MQIDDIHLILLKKLVTRKNGVMRFLTQSCQNVEYLSLDTDHSVLQLKYYNGHLSKSKNENENKYISDNTKR